MDTTLSSFEFTMNRLLNNKSNHQAPHLLYLQPREERLRHLYISTLKARNCSHYSKIFLTMFSPLTEILPGQSNVMKFSFYQKVSIHGLYSVVQRCTYYSDRRILLFHFLSFAQHGPHTRQQITDHFRLKQCPISLEISTAGYLLSWTVLV